MGFKKHILKKKKKKEAHFVAGLRMEEAFKGQNCKVTVSCISYVSRIIPGAGKK